MYSTLQTVNIIFEQIMAGKMSQPGSGLMSVHSHHHELPELSADQAPVDNLARQSIGSATGSQKSDVSERHAFKAPVKNQPFASITMAHALRQARAHRRSFGSQ